MLFAYQYLNHSMEIMQEYIDYIFEEVWSKAPSYTYSFDLFNSKPDLKEIVESFHYSSTQGGDFFNSKIEEIFQLFKQLNATQIAQMKKWYQANNNIEALCCCDPQVPPVRYSDISNVYPKLTVALKGFFSRLYSQEMLSLKAIKDKIGNIGEHYKAFIRLNRKGKCPFCGLYDIDNEYVHTREAYDHFLPKSEYPFSSINFKNLAPICNKCNSGNKGSKDPLFNSNGNRRKSFYIYSLKSHMVEISLNINTYDFSCLTPDCFEIILGPDSINEELETWNDLFEIKQRYKAKCCSEEAKYWIQQVIEESENYGLSPDTILESKLAVAARNPFVDMNFLRKPFLEACECNQVFNQDRLRTSCATAEEGAGLRNDLL